MIRRAVPNADHGFGQLGCAQPLARAGQSGSTGGKAGEDSAVRRSDTSRPLWEIMVDDRVMSGLELRFSLMMHAR